MPSTNDSNGFDALLCFLQECIQGVTKGQIVFECQKKESLFCVTLANFPAKSFWFNITDVIAHIGEEQFFQAVGETMFVEDRNCPFSFLKAGLLFIIHRTGYGGVRLTFEGIRRGRLTFLCCIWITDRSQASWHDDDPEVA
jgi:hypothetical protein